MHALTNLATCKPLWEKRLCSKKQSGAGMIEVLVAIVIVAFALLGMAGLQVATLRYQKAAHFRGIAAQYAAEIGDRIRANKAGATAGNYVAEGTYSAPACAPYTPVDCSAAGSNAAVAACLAAQDINHWRSNMSCGMSGGWGEISGNFASNGYLVVRVYFRDPGAHDSTGASSAIDRYLDTDNCRAGALNATDLDVRCFRTVVVP